MSETVFLEQTNKTIRVTDGNDQRQYVTHDPNDLPPTFKKFIENEAYTEALNGLVIQCVDILLYDPEEQKVLVGTRQQEPHAGDWVIGGRMRAGESLQDAAARNMKRELGISIDESKLKEVGDYEMIWDTRAQGSGTNEAGEEVTGCHMSSKLELYPITPEEKSQLVFNEEYAALVWTDPFEIVDAPAGKYHPCLVDMLEDGLEVMSDPGEPSSLEEAHLRTIGEIATLRAELEDLEQGFKK